MRSWQRYVVGLTSIALVAGMAEAQSSPQREIAFDTWTVSDGLPQGSIYDIVQTRDGYLWLATLGGLVRFDGVRFTVFEKASAPGIAGNRFTTLFEDRSAALWAGTDGNGVTRYAQGTFRTFTSREGLPHDRIRSVDQDSNGRILVLTDRGIARLSGERFERISYADVMPSNPEAVAGTSIHAGISLRDAGGLHTLFGGNHHFFSVERVGAIESRYRDQRGVLWGHRDGTLFRFDGAEVTRRNIPRLNGRVIGVLEDRQKALWLSVEGQYVMRIRGEEMTRFTPADGLAGPTVAVMFEDREGNIWLGSLLNGLSRFRHRPVATISERNGLPVENVYPLLQRGNGEVWVGTWGGGLARVDRGAVDPTSIILRSQYISALTEDRAGDIWAGTSGSGLFRIRNGKVTSTALPGAFVFALHEDRNGTMWVGSGDGLRAISHDGTRFYGVSAGLPRSHVQAILEDSGGTLWLGTLGGVARFDGRTFKTIGEREGLSSNHVRCLYRDSAGVIWAGTYDGGLNRIDGDRVVAIQKQHGLFDNGVFAILDDGRGNFWMTSNRGIFRTRKRDLEDFAAGRIRFVHSTGYGVEDGMLSPECNGGTQPAGLRMDDGRLWFPTQRGIAVIHPARVPINAVPPPVWIETVIAEELSYAGRASLDLPRGTSRVRVEYTALSFIKPEQMRFRYRLEGLDDEWIEAGAERTAVYSHVPPGRYTFRVRAANSDGIWNDQGASIILDIPPPFWRTRWFIGAASLSLLLALFALHRLRVRSLEHERAAERSFLRRTILAEEAERTRIAAELHDSLGQSLMVISNRALMAKRDAERGRPFEEHLQHIAEASTQAADEVREIAHNLHPQHLERLGLTRALQTLIERAADSGSVEIGGKIDPVDGVFPPELELSFYRLVQEALANVLRHADAKHAEVTIDHHGGRVAIAVRDDGRGFDKPAGGSAGLGLESIRQRAAMLGGTLRIESHPGTGTLVRVEIPLPERHANA